MRMTSFKIRKLQKVILRELGKTPVTMDQILESHILRQEAGGTFAEYRSEIVDAVLELVEWGFVGRDWDTHGTAIYWSDI